MAGSGRRMPPRIDAGCGTAPKKGRPPKCLGTFGGRLVCFVLFPSSSSCDLTAIRIRGGWAPPCACFSAESSRAIPPGGRLLRADPLRSNALWNRSSSTGGVVVGQGRLRCPTCRSLHHEHRMLSPISIIHTAFASGNHHAGKEPSATCASFMTLLNYASSLLLIGSRQAGRRMRHAVEAGRAGRVYSVHLLPGSSQSRCDGGYSSVGRASDCGSEGRAFEPR